MALCRCKQCEIHIKTNKQKPGSGHELILNTYNNNDDHKNR